MDENTSSDVYVATKTSWITVGTRRERITKGVTRVAAGHEVLASYPEFFKAADPSVRFGTENAVDRPPSGNRNPVTSDAEPVPYRERRAKELKNDIENRNKSRGPDEQIEFKGNASVAVLAELLEYDDLAQEEKAAQEEQQNPDGSAPDESGGDQAPIETQGLGTADVPTTAGGSGERTGA